MNISVQLFFQIFHMDYLNNSASMNFTRLLAMKHHQKPLYVNGIPNSIVAVVHYQILWTPSKNSLLFQNTLMLCMNWYCKIISSLIRRLRHPWAKVGPAYIQYFKNIWPSKKFIHIHSKNGSCRLVKEMLKKYPKVLSNKSCSCTKHFEAVTCFFEKTGHLTTVLFSAVNFKWYTICCCQKYLEK